jgi:hypothetical protein
MLIAFLQATFTQANIYPLPLVIKTGALVYISEVGMKKLLSSSIVDCS